MRSMKTIAEMQFYSKKMREDKKSIGFIPTMGYFHEGHVSLMKESRLKNDITVVSVFVNPIQFGKNEDFSSYPRDPDRDSQITMEAGVDILFTPSQEEMYSSDFSTYVDPGTIGDLLCGAYRPGHFKGVATVVTKLFNIVKPHRAYFGQKDFQQSMVIKKIARDLNLDLEIIVLPIIREKDGLAMSSRNVYLSPEERKSAAILNKSLKEAEHLIKSGEKKSDIIISHIEKMIKKIKAARIEYISIIDKNTLQNKNILDSDMVIALAIYIGNTRLIDNIEIQNLI
ncbi:pantoate--beta-alanine ligase [Candidatus Poribacteria bacterium]|nr:pantoate--beta-alanine ligase [Candidatus Poribacteria bacterium]